MYFLLTWTNLSFGILSVGPLVEAHEVDKSFLNRVDEHLFLHCFRLCHTPVYNITQKAIYFDLFQQNIDFGVTNSISLINESAKELLITWVRALMIPFVWSGLEHRYNSPERVDNSCIKKSFTEANIPKWELVTGDDSSTKILSNTRLQK